MKAFYINGGNPFLESKIERLWTVFALKTEPIPLKGRTLAEKLSSIKEYWNNYFVGGLCFFFEEVEGFAVYSFDVSKLDEPISTKSTEKTAVLVMGVSFNKGIKEINLSIQKLKKTFESLKKDYGATKIVWNVNREKKKQPFLKFLEKFGENKGKYWQAL